MKVPMKWKMVSIFIAYASLLSVMVGCSSEKKDKASDKSNGVSDQLTPFTSSGSRELLSSFTQGKTRRTNLVEVPVSSEYNTQVFIDNDQSVEAKQNKVFVAPKLFVYGNREEGKVVTINHPNGNVTISFNAAFIDGSGKNFWDPKSGKYINVPYEYQIHDIEGLKNELQASLKKGVPTLSSLEGCPKKILVSYAGNEYDVTPSWFMSGDRCTLVPFTVSLTVTKFQAKDILYNYLPNGMIDVASLYETRTSLPVFHIAANITKKSIYEDLLASLKVNWFVKADAQLAVTKILRNRKFQLNVQGDIEGEELERITSRIMDTFFEPMASLPDRVVPAECDQIACLQFSKTSFSEEDVMDFGFNQDSNQMVGYTYVSSSKMKKVDRLTKLIGKDESCKENCERLVSGGGVKPSQINVDSNSKVVLRPELLIHSVRRETESYSHESHETCEVTYLHATGMSVRDCNRHHGIPDGGFGKTICNSCYSGFHDNWIKRATYHSDIANVPYTNPGLEMLFDLNIAFIGIDKTTARLSTVECTISSFRTEESNGFLIVSIGKSDSCSPFSRLKDVRIGFRDPIVYPEQEYLEGNEVMDWRGVTLEEPVRKTFKQSRETVLSVSLDEEDPYGLK